MNTLKRFLEAQDGGDPTALERALAELREGRKRSHWIWFVLPQLRCLCKSQIAIHYGIEDLAEAREYLKNQKLRGRLIEVIMIIEQQLMQQNQNLELLMGKRIDAVKTISSLTLFEAAGLRETSPLLDQLGRRCKKTLKALKIPRIRHDASPISAAKRRLH